MLIILCSSFDFSLNKCVFNNLRLLFLQLKSNLDIPESNIIHFLRCSLPPCILFLGREEDKLPIIPGDVEDSGPVITFSKEYLHLNLNEQLSGKH